MRVFFQIPAENTLSLLRLGDSVNSEAGKRLVAASFLDYHVFRQDIVAKYMAYDPPRPRLMFELATISLVPSSTINTPTSGRGGDGRGRLEGGFKTWCENLEQGSSHCCSCPVAPTVSRGCWRKMREET